MSYFLLFNLYLGRPRFRVLSKQSKKNHKFVRKFCQAEYIICIPDGSIFRGTPEHVWSIRSGSKSLYPANMTFISLWCLFCFYCVNLNFSISGSCRNNSVSRLWQKLEKIEEKKPQRREIWTSATIRKRNSYQYWNGLIPFCALFGKAGLFMR